MKSHLTRGAWIEISFSLLIVRLAKSHLTRGAWIEIGYGAGYTYLAEGRTSHEVRGLKYWQAGTAGRIPMSHLTRGAWIEIFIPLPELV